MIKNVKAKSLVNYALNLGIRGATIGCKFLFTLFLSKYYSEEILGRYGLFSTTVLLSFAVLSFSFESYGLREIIQKPKETQPSFIRNLFLFFASSLAICLPVIILIIKEGTIDHDLVWYFAAILILETFSQVFFSLFTILQQSISANLILFFSQAIWIVISLLLWFFNPTGFNTLEDFLKFWILGEVISCTYGLMRVIGIYKVIVLHPVNWNWIRKGLGVSVIFFSSAISYKLIEFADRYFIEFKLGASKLGIYVFYSQIANLLNTVINVTVVLMLYPRLIENYVKKDMDAFLVIKAKMYQRVVAIGMILSLVAVLFIRLALSFIGKESFQEEISVFYILLAANIAMNLSFIPHYCLYAMHEDRILLFTTVAGAMISVILNLALIPLLGIHGAAVATGLSFSTVWALKALYLKKKFKELGHEKS